jgi:predicted Ser/Thr protein kinase
MLEFVEMFKAPIKMLHPLLTATQEGNYIGTENIGAIPFTGIMVWRTPTRPSGRASRPTRTTKPSSTASA